MENFNKIVCNICLEADLSKEISGIVEPCHHVYCFNCIEKWLKLKLTCPNCLVLISKLSKKNENIIEEIDVNDLCSYNSNFETDEKVNLDCLDHNYFKTEIRNLENRLIKIINLLSKSNHNKDFDLENKWDLIENLKDNIKTKLDIVQNLDHFNSECLLSEIYELDLLFTKIELNKWKEIDLDIFIESLPQKFIGENNVIVETYDYVEDYEEDENNYYYKSNNKYSNKFEIDNYNKLSQKTQKVSNSKKKKNKKKNKEII